MSAVDGPFSTHLEQSLIQMCFEFLDCAYCRGRWLRRRLRVAGGFIALPTSHWPVATAIVVHGALEARYHAMCRRVQATVSPHPATCVVIDGCFSMPVHENRANTTKVSESPASAMP
jgi:hypothetical protein